MRMNEEEDSNSPPLVSSTKPVSSFSVHGNFSCLAHCRVKGNAHLQQGCSVSCGMINIIIVELHKHRVHAN